MANKNTTKVNLINYQRDRKTDLTQTRVNWEERRSTEEMLLSDGLLDVSGGIFLIIKLDVGGTVHCVQYPGHMKKQAGDAIEASQ